MRNLTVTAVLALTLAVACSSGDDGDDVGGDDTTAEVTTTTPDVTAEPGTSAPTTGGAEEVPTACTEPVEREQPANEGRVDDLDGDGEPDTVWVASPGGGLRVLGVATAAGGGAKVEIESASPVPIQVLVADADGTPPVELFVSDGRGVQLWAFQDCRLQPVTDPGGRPYLFDLGLRGYGTGVGCVDGQLVGLNVTTEDADGTVHWARTVITRDGLVADEGTTTEGTYRRPGDDAAIELLHQVTCGDRTLAADGIAQPDE
ncbi:MAG TPA: hypothetical protein VIL36_00405 [Acidimicrobiales bacterium]